MKATSPLLNGVLAENRKASRQASWREWRKIGRGLLYLLLVILLAMVTYFAVCLAFDLDSYLYSLR